MGHLIGQQDGEMLAFESFACLQYSMSIVVARKAVERTRSRPRKVLVRTSVFPRSLPCLPLVRSENHGNYYYYYFK